MLTNSLPAIHDLTNHPAANFDAWHLVALGAGATLVHAYHTIVNAGGLKKIWSSFWNGPSNPTNPPPKT